MDNYIMINGKRIELTEEQIKILTEPKEEEKKDVIYRVDNNCPYYIINAEFSLCLFSEYNSKDKERFEKGNYYPPECYDLAIQDALHQELNSRLRKFTRNHGWNEDVWNDVRVDKWNIYKDTELGVFSVQVWRRTKSNEVYFISDKIAEQAIEEVVKPFIEEHKEFIW